MLLFCLFTYTCLATDIISGVHAVGKDRFYYTKNDIQSPIFYRRSNDEEACKLCFGVEDCFELEESRCEFYKETANVLHDVKDDERVVEYNEEIEEEVDRIMYDLAVKAADDDNFEECIPLLSEYNNCHKENVCIGCTRCTCNRDGRWSCTEQEKCRPDPVILNVDHRTLMIVMDNLMAVEAQPRDRKKRSPPIYDSTTKTYPKPTKKSSSKNASFKYSQNVMNMSESLFKEIQTNLSKDSKAKLSEVKMADTEYFSFDELLKNIANDKVNINKNLDGEYFELNNTYDSDHFLEMLNDVEGIHFYSTTELGLSEPPTEKNEPTIVDENLSQINNKNDNFMTDDMDFLNMEDSNIIKDYNDINSVNIMKRDVSSVNITNNETESISQMNYVNKNVLQPLSDIITDKQSEIDELLVIRENLLGFLKLHDYKMNLTWNETTVNDKKPHFSFYELKIMPITTEANYRRAAENDVIKRYLKKLKGDIIEILRDIYIIKKVSKNHQIPDDLKTFMKVMRYYIQKQVDVNNKNKPSTQTVTAPKWLKQPFVRRNLMNLPRKTCYIQESLSNIFETIDKGMPQSHALDPLSHKTKIVIERVIKQLYKDDSFEHNLNKYNIHDTNALTINLKGIGQNWKKTADVMFNCTVYDRLYKMKMLHLYLCIDSHKISDTIDILYFANSRRIMPVDSKEGNRIISVIKKKLDNTVHDIEKLTRLINTTVSQLTETYDKNSISKKESRQKKSFLNYLKNLLTGSTRATADDKTISKSFTKKQSKEAMMKKRMEDYQKTMRVWQEHFQTIRRHKRSPHEKIKKFKQRMRNILPKYLRGKVNPALHGKKSKIDTGVQNKSLHHKQN